MKNSKKKEIFLLAFLVILLFIINYPFLNNVVENFLLDYETVFVDRVIDGDTIVSNETHIRLLGINTPERGEKYYEEAKTFLEGLVLNETVRLEFGKDKIDRYGRTLAYIHINNRNINLELVEKGFANYYFPSGKDIHYKEFSEVWEECLNNKVNLCEPSTNKCANCIELQEFDYENEIILLYNSCSFDCDLNDWSIKDEGRKKFVFKDFTLPIGGSVKIIVSDKNETDSKNILYWRGEDYVWTKSGDTVFLRDSDGKLVLWEGY